MIRVRNVFHMLAYAFSALTEQGYRSVATEDFDNAAELCAAILERGVSVQLKRGLGQEYVNRTEARSSLRGKIEVTDSVKSQAILRRQLVCSYDEFSVDTTMNRVIKATVALLVRSDISRARKKSLKKLMVYFAMVFAVVLELIQMRHSTNLEKWNHERWQNMTGDAVKAELLPNEGRESSDSEGKKVEK